MSGKLSAAAAAEQQLLLIHLLEYQNVQQSSWQRQKQKNQKIQNQF